MGDLSRLLSQAIFLPGRRKRKQEGTLPKSPADTAVSASTGSVVLIGGTSLSDELILGLIRLAGGRNRRIAVVPTASLEFARSGERYARSFRRFGVRNVEIIDIATRPLADDPERAAKLAKAHLIFLGGGDNALFLDILKDTAAHAALKEAFQGGTTLAGIGAGAAVLGAVVPVRTGNEDPSVAQGLGFLSVVLLDHNLARHGIARGIFSTMATSGSAPGSEPPGIGIDDGTALVVSEGRIARVFGSGMVLVVTRRQDADSATAATLEDFSVKILPPDFGYDLAQRRLLPPQGDAGPPLRQAR